jgi:Xaa-Pro aminopeptidase
MNEFEVAAKMDYELRRRGCKRLGYGSIVAGGKNAACLHYRSNNEPLVDGQMLLIDAGGEYEMFSADITRTFPIGRKFTDEHARLYDIVLRSQKAAIDLAKPGMTLAAIHKKATEILIEGLVDLGFLSGKVEDLFASGAHRRFYTHNTSHWLGMDVHDAGLYQIDGVPRKLEKGMVFTIEPGLYVQPGDTGVPSGYRNCGIRIEDDILITDKGCEILTVRAPKERAEIEALRA